MLVKFDFDRNRLGADLDNLNFQQLHSLEEDIIASSAAIRERKVQFIQSLVSIH